MLSDDEGAPAYGAHVAPPSAEVAMDAVLEPDMPLTRTMFEAFAPAWSTALAV